MASITRQRYIFRRIKQGRNEKISDWERRLRKQAKFCNFSNDDEQIFDQIVEKTSIFKLRREACYQDNNITLSQLLEFARQIENNEIKCTRCGSVNHRFYDSKKYPAFNRRCSQCDCIGHYTEHCFNKTAVRCEQKTALRDDVKKRRVDQAATTKNKTSIREESQKWLGEIEEHVGKFTLLKNSPSTSGNIVKDPRLIKREKQEENLVESR
jgi:hypothetical protein